ncbi:MAG: hypothetical protein HAW59_01865 [Betaproteobacteria bacterium]|nr:hypothetical protein [Betaproteobacteria bacterium]
MERQRERQKLNTAQNFAFWIPAYAGMTAAAAGEFGGGEGREWKAKGEREWRRFW